MYTVYMHIFPNGKRYIGITKFSASYRWGENGKKYKNQKLMYNAILKYGWDNIEHIVLAENLTKEEACTMECSLIAYYSSNSRDKGYNVSSGGEYGSTGVVRTEEFKENARLRNIGKHLSDATKEKIRQSVSRQMHGKSHPLHKIELDSALKIYNDVCEGIPRIKVAKKYGVSNSVVDRIVTKQHWTVQDNLMLFTRTLPTIYLYQYDLKGNYVRRWNRVLDVVDALGINYGSISSCCKGKLSKAGGYKWKWIAVLDTGEEVDYDI